MVRVLVTHCPVSVSHLRPLSFHLLEHRVLTLNLSPQHPSRVRAAQRLRVTPSRSRAPTFEQLYLPQNYIFTGRKRSGQVQRLLEADSPGFRSCFLVFRYLGVLQQVVEPNCPQPESRVLGPALHSAV